MLLAGLGVGALASQLGAVTVSSVPDEQSGEVGGLQNTVTNLGASIGTALAGAVLISALTSSFFTGIQDNPDVPKDLASKAETELAAGIPFVSDATWRRRSRRRTYRRRRPTRSSTRTPPRASTASGPHSRCSRLSRFALLFSRRLPTRQPARRLPLTRPRILSRSARTWSVTCRSSGTVARW